jgi:hypothetical protein
MQVLEALQSVSGPNLLHAARMVCSPKPLHARRKSDYVQLIVQDFLREQTGFCDYDLGHIPLMSGEMCHCRLSVISHHFCMLFE